MALVKNVTQGTEGDQQKSEVPAQVELYCFDVNPITSRWENPEVAPLYYFYDGTDSDGEPVVFRGRTYVPTAIKATGFSKMGPEGTLPRPRLKVGNVDGYLSSLLRSYNDLVGAHVTRLVTYEPYLDGHAEEDPLKAREEITFIINRLMGETKFEIEWELRYKSDQQLQIPRKQIGPFCPTTVIYRNPDTCGWTGANFDINDKKQGWTGYNGVDECAKRLSSCKVRWQDGQEDGTFGDPTAVLPFGGYPGAARPIN
jgi:lambda family phage minor tail protein L